MRFYGYKGCDTCRKAKKWLDERGVEFEEIPIREQPPSRRELRLMLGYLGGELKRLFNTSSKDYREMGGKDRLADMSVEDAFDTLAANGNLVKRPFVLVDDDGTVGFKPDEWANKFGTDASSKGREER